MKDSLLWNGYSAWNIYCPEDTCHGSNESGFISPWDCVFFMTVTFIILDIVGI